MASTLDEFRDMLDRAIKHAGTQTRLASDLGVRMQTITSWRYGSYPRAENIDRLKTYLHDARIRDESDDYEEEET